MHNYKLRANPSTFARFLSVLAFTLTFICTASYAAVVTPPAPDVAAEGFVLMDYDTGHVIADKNADMQLAPASLTKMMTTYVIGKELEAGNISPKDLDLIKLVDTEDEVVEIIDAFYKGRTLSPNF